MIDILMSSMDFSEKLVLILIIAFSVLMSLSVHELAHGFSAYLMGDRTAQSMGRLSLNPLAHLDPIGALCLLLFGFGWAKPVMINPWNFKNKKAGMALSALAGPIANFILAFVAMIGFTILGGLTFTSTESVGYNVGWVAYNICWYLVMMNLGLGIFNLIPIPPLDGSKVLNAILPQNLYFKIMQYERYGFIILIILINMPFFDKILWTIQSGVIELYSSIIGLFI